MTSDRGWWGHLARRKNYGDVDYGAVNLGFMHVGYGSLGAGFVVVEYVSSTTVGPSCEVSR